MTKRLKRKQMAVFRISIHFQYFTYIFAKFNTFSRSSKPISQFNTFKTAWEPCLPHIYFYLPIFFLFPFSRLPFKCPPWSNPSTLRPHNHISAYALYYRSVFSHRGVTRGCGFVAALLASGSFSVLVKAFI